MCNLNVFYCHTKSTTGSLVQPLIKPGSVCVCVDMYEALTHGLEAVQVSTPSLCEKQDQFESQHLCSVIMTLRAAPINSRMFTMDQMTAVRRSLLHWQNQGELSLDSAVPLSPVEYFYIFQLIVLFLWPATLRAWFGALISFVSAAAAAGSCFSG